MEISDELIACYIEGTVTTEERNVVRRYLCEHPEEYERVLCLMDNDIIDYLGEQLEISENCIPMNESSFSEIVYSAAAFAPEQNKLFIRKNRSMKTQTDGLYDRLGRMNSELDLI